MGKRKPEEDETIPAMPQDESPPAGPVAGYVRIINMEPCPKDVTLHDGTNVRLGPFSKANTAHISEPILKKLIPDAVKKLAVRRWVKLEEVK